MCIDIFLSTRAPHGLTGRSSTCSTRPFSASLMSSLSPYRLVAFSDNCLEDMMGCRDDEGLQGSEGMRCEMGIVAVSALRDSEVIVYRCIRRIRTTDVRTGAVPLRLNRNKQRGGLSPQSLCECDSVPRSRRRNFGTNNQKRKGLRVASSGQNEGRSWWVGTPENNSPHSRTALGFKRHKGRIMA